MVSDNLCCEITLPKKLIGEIYVTTIAPGSIDSGEPIAIKLPNGNQFSGNFKKYSNEPVPGEPFTTRAHIITYD